MMSYVFFMWFLSMSIIMSLSTSSLFFLWVCLEFNMMSFIPLMYSKNLISMNSVMMYFLIQSTASSIYIFSISIFFLNSFFINYMYMLVMISMLIKLGAAPFHYWLPQISEGLTFYILSILLTLQKMIPLYITSIFKTNFLILFILMSAIMGSIGGFNQFSTRKILAFSSISHLAWILSLQLINSNFWIIYLMIYSLIIIILIKILYTYSINFINFSKKMNPYTNFLFIIMLLSLGGMPPTIGFIVKWMSLKIIVNSMTIILIPLIFSSLINLFFYFRLSYNSIFKFMNLNKWEKPMFSKYMLIITVQAMTIFLLIASI
uniref:NADH dehydrogenase subunit 2 n=1 Tax=Alectorobius microlophi TaxID=1232731 RepID=UPI0022390DE9|nr:NADH dehydrogenase subunit 2 [Alectorobius microlophi]UYB78418.1 NADH dehydrogenase subunit 2 [Alectorobius microlophi]